TRCAARPRVGGCQAAPLAAVPGAAGPAGASRARIEAVAAQWVRRARAFLRAGEPEAAAPGEPDGAGDHWSNGHVNVTCQLSALGDSPSELGVTVISSSRCGSDE